METALAYCRVSDPRQVDEGNSLVTQEKQAREYAQKSGYHLDRVFVERGESAKTNERHVLKEMLNYCEQNKGRIQVVIIPKIDRLARNRDDYGLLKGFLSRLQIRLDSVGERIEDTPVGRFTESILASVAQFDNEIRAERCKGGMIEAAKEGRWMWKAPKGYKNVRVDGKANIAPDERLGPIMREAFERIASGSYSSQAVCHWLQAHGVRVTISRLHEILHNKAYLGIIEPFGLNQKGAHPFVPLVSRATFYRAQEVLRRKSQAKTYEHDHPDFPLRGTVVCECGRFFTAYWKQKPRARYGYYRCMKCPRTNIPRDRIEGAFQTELGNFKFTQRYVEQVTDAVVAHWKERYCEEIDRVERVHKEIAQLESLRSKIAIKNAEGITPDNVAKSQMDEIGIKIGALAVEQQANLPRETELTKVLEFGTMFLTEMPFYWASSPLPERKKLQSFLYPRGLVYKKDGTFRTADYPVLEQIKKGISEAECDLVDLNDEHPNRLLTFLQGLCTTFS